MNTPTQLNPAELGTLQHHLLDAHTAWKQFLRDNNLPTHLCLHLAPDLCWISVEHEYQKELIPGTPEGTDDPAVREG